MDYMFLEVHAVKPGQCVKQSTGHVSPAAPILLRLHPRVSLTLTPTGEGTAAEICIHLSQQGGQVRGRARRGARHSQATQLSP